MIIISDGDIIRNQFHIPSGDPLPLGYDQFTRETFGNKTFILNSLNYLIDGPGLISLRSREISLRLLDKTKVSASGITWQVVNMALPVIIVLVFAVLMIYQRKRKYTT
jgi:ABC-2 type transport system permease protein